jgi:Leucine-rich repeat (LRR) protein
LSRSLPAQDLRIQANGAVVAVAAEPGKQYSLFGWRRNGTSIFGGTTGFAGGRIKIDRLAPQSPREYVLVGSPRDVDPALCQVEMLRLRILGPTKLRHEARRAEAVGTTPGLAATNIVNIPDAALLFSIRNYLGKPRGPITELDMLSLTTLDAGSGYHPPRHVVADLTGLEYARNLEQLELVGNHVSNLSPLSNLTKLTYLDLRGNRISSLSPLSKLTKLAYLDLRGNCVSNLSPLSNLTRLTYLDLHGNRIRNLTPLSELTRLIYLHLSSNRIAGLRPLTGLDNFENLDLAYNDIAHLGPLSKLTQLTALDLRQNQITDLRPLSNLTRMAGLILSRNQITDLSPLTALKELGWLGVTHNYLDLTPDSAAASVIRDLKIRGVGVSYRPQDVPPKVIGGWERKRCRGPLFSDLHRFRAAVLREGPPRRSPALPIASTHHLRQSWGPSPTPALYIRADETERKVRLHA